jgi:hypothetical protein
MESEMLAIIGLINFFFITVVLVSIIGAVVYIEKRLSHSSWFRGNLAVIAGLGASIIGLIILVPLIIKFVEVVISNNDISYILMYDWWDGVIIATVQWNPEAEINSSLINFLIYFLAMVLEIAVFILGGYIGGKIARQNENIYGFLVGLGVILVYVIFNNKYFLAPPFHKLYLAVIYFSAAILGGYFALWLRKRNQTKFPLENVIKLNKQGEWLEAQKLLKPLIAADHNNLPAWFLLVETYPTYQQKINVLEICLEQNPDNEKVKQMLDNLHQSMAKDSV